MPNILINPNSGLIEFTTGAAGGSSFNANFTGGAFATRLSYDNFGGININSYVSNTSGLDRFSIDGANGRLFNVTDNLSGSLFSVNDIAGLPIIEAFDDNTVVMGAFNRNDFVLTGNSLGLGGLPNTGTTKLYVSGNINVIGSGIFSNPVTAPNLVYNTGNQTISGVKTFATGIFAPNLVYNTGDQTISGNKTFIDNISVSGTSIFNAIDLNDVDNLSLSGVDITITNGDVTVNDTKVALSNQIFSTFPPGTGVRRYRPDGVVTLSTLSPSSGVIGYLPFIIKKLAINPKISVEVSSVGNATPIRYGIYSGISGFEGAKLFNSGSIDCLGVAGIYTSNISVNLLEGPYIIATSNTGVSFPTQFRCAAANMAPTMFGEPTGNSFFGSSSIHFYQTGEDLPPIIGTGLFASSAVTPIAYISY